MENRRIGPDGGFIRDIKETKQRLASLETKPAGKIVVRETLTTTDPETGVKTVFGQLPDGSYGLQPFIYDITPPPVASTPSVSAEPGLFSVTWDGLFVGNAEQPRDFVAVNVIGHKMSGATTVSSVPVGRLTSALSRIYISTDIVAVGETWKFSLESEDYNGNRSEWSTRSVLLTMQSLATDAAVDTALTELNAASQAASAAAVIAQQAAQDAQDDADAAAASALAANNLAGSKGTIYTRSTAPSADYSGLWIDTANNNIPRRYLGVRSALVINAGGGANIQTRLSSKGWAVSAITTVPTFEDSVKYDLVAMDAGYAGLGTSYANLATKLYNRGVSLYTSGNDTTSLPPLFTGASSRGTTKNSIQATNNILGITYNSYADSDLNYYLTGVNSAAVVTGTTFVTSLGTDQPLNLVLEHPTNFSRWVHIETYATPAVVIDLHLDWLSNNWVAIQDQLVISTSSAAASAQIRADQAFNSATSAATIAGNAQSAADGKNTIWYQDEQPAGIGHKIADTWFDTNDNYKIRTWNGSIWQTTQDSWLAQQTADSKGITYTQNTVPPVEARLPQNLWNDTSLGLDKVVVKYWSTTAGAWTALADKAATEARIVADSKGETIYSSAEPTAAQRLPQNLWVDTTGGINLHKRWSGSAWVVVADSRISTTAAEVSALSSQVSAVSAQADRSITTFFGTTSPTAPESGDIWLTGVAGEPMKRYNGSIWQTFEDPNVQAAFVKAGDAQAAADGKVRTFAQDTEPGNMVPNDVGDIWIDTNDNNKMWRYSGAAWFAFQDGDIALAQQKADSAFLSASAAAASAQYAQATADGKNTNYYQPLQPTGGTYKVGDTWFDSDDNYKIRTFIGGTTWQLTQDSAGAQAAAILAASSDATQKASDAEQAAITAAGLYADAETARAKQEAIDAAAITAQAKADAAELAAIDAAAITAQLKADGASQEAIDAAAITAAQLADAAELAAIDAAAITAGQLATQAKTDAITAAATDAQTKATQAKADAIQAASDDATAKADLAQRTAIQALGYSVNPSFEDWTSTYPVGFAAFNTAPTKETTTVRTGKFAMRFNSTDTTTQRGVTSTSILAHAPNLEYFTLELDVRLDSGSSFGGSGILLDWNGMTGGNRVWVSLASEIPSPIVGRWYRVTKVIRRPVSAVGTHTGYNIWIMGQYGTGLGTQAIKNVIFDWMNIRPATTEEITAFGTPASITALSDTVNTKTKSWFQNGQPPLTGNTTGDLWFDTDDNNKIYIWNGAWSVASDQRIESLNTAVSAAQTSANGKNKIYYNTSPATGTVGYVAGDTWYQLSGTNIIGQWEFTTSWQSRVLSHQVVASIDAAKITVGNLDVANRVAAGAISANKLFVGDLTNLASDGNFTDLNKVNWVGSGTVMVSAGEPNRLRITTAASGNNDHANGNLIQVTGGEQIYGEVWVYGATTNVGSGGPNIHMAVTDNNNAPSWPTFQSLGRSAVSGVWTKLSGKVTMPANAKTAKVELAVSYAADAVGNVYYFRNVVVRRMASGELIVDGAIKANSAIIETGAIGTAHIADLAVKTAEIDNLAVTTAKIENLAVTTAKIENLAVTNAQIANATIQAAKIGSVDAGTITVGQLSAAQISATAIDGKTITGATVQTQTTASRGIKLTSTELAGYDASGNKNFSLASDGTLTVKGNIKSGSTIEGATITGTNGLETSTIANTGVKVTNSGIKAYDAGNNLSFSVNAATGEVEAPGLKANSINGTKIESGTILAEKMLIANSSNVIVDPAFFNPTLSAYRTSVSAGGTAGWTLNTGTATTMRYYSRTTASTNDQFHFITSPITAGTSQNHIQVSDGQKWSFSVDVETSIAAVLRWNIYLFKSDGTMQYWGLPWNASATGKRKLTGEYTVPAGVVAFAPAIASNTTGVLWKVYGNAYVGIQANSTLIEPGAITTNHMTAGTIDGGIITADTLAGTAVKAKSISVDKLVISSTDNLIMEASFEHPLTPGASWTRGTNQIIQPIGGRYGTAAMRLTGTTSINYTYNLLNKVPVTADTRFRIAMWVKTNVAYPNDQIRFGVTPYSGTTKNDNVALFRNSDIATIPGPTPGSTIPHPRYVPGGDVWTLITGVTDLLPATTTHVEFFVNCSSPSTSAYVDIDSVMLTRASDGTLVVDGAISADKLNAKIVLASKIIAGDETGTHAEMSPTGFKVFAKNLAATGGPPTEAVRLGVADSDDYFAITQANGKYAASISQQGVGSFSTLYTLKSTSVSGSAGMVSGGFYYDGKELSALLDERPRGIIAAAYRTTSSAYNVYVGGPFYPYLRVEATLEPGRLYKVWTSPVRTDVDNGIGCTVGVAYNNTTYATVDNGNHFVQGFVQPNSTGGRDSVTIQELFLPIGITVPTVYSFLLVYGIQNTASGVGSGFAGLRGSPTHPVRLVIEDVGPTNANIGSGVSLDGTVAPPPPVNTYVKRWDAVDSRNYQGNNAEYPFDSGRMYQGLSPAGYGNLKSIAMFGLNGHGETMTGAVSGATINYIRVYFNFEHWYYNSGGTARIGVHPHTSLPGSFTYVGNGQGGGLVVSSGGWPKPGARWVDIPSDQFPNFQNGIWKGIVLEGDTTYGTYGYAQRPTIEISYTK